jgi:hypothetical protein
MNTLAHIAAMVAVGWLVFWMFTELNEPVLAVAGVTVLAWLFPMTWMAVLEDKEILSQS